MRFSRNILYFVLPALACSGLSLAQSLDIPWYSIDAGGAMLTTGGNFELSGTIGQSDAGSPAVPLTGGPFELVGGFWLAVIQPSCPGDTNADGLIDLTDLATLLSNFGATGGATPAQGDCDADGDVELSDLTILLSRFGTGCP